MALTDLTRISTSGIATGSSLSGAILHSDVHFRGNQVGVNSAIFDSSERELNLKDNVKLTFGDVTNGDLRIYHDTSNGSYIREAGPGALRIQGDAGIWMQSTGNQDRITATNDAVNLFSGGIKRFNTTSTGAVVTGILTATSFSGPILGSPINNPSGISTFYDLRVSNNLTVEGTTTTLDTDLTAVDRVEVGADSDTIVGVAITQSGTADILKLVGSTDAVTIKKNGRIGIGTITPLAGLHLSDGTAYGSPQITNRKAQLIISAGSENSADMQFLASSYNHIFFGTSSDANAGGIFYHHTGSYTNSFQIENGGAQTFFRPSGTLDIKSADAQGNSFMQSFLIRDSGNNAQYQIGMYQNNTQHLFINNMKGDIRIAHASYDHVTFASDGRVGIGTNLHSPSFKLDLREPHATAYAANASPTQLGIGNINSSANTNFSGIHMYSDGNGRGIVNLNCLNNSTNASADFAIQTRHSGTLYERFRITSDGKIGIGHHSGSQISHELTIRPANGGGIRLVRPGETSATPNTHLNITTTTSGSAFPSGEAYTVKYKTNNCDALFETYSSGGTGGNFSFRTGAGSGNQVERLRILSNGNIGIGTNNPVTELEIHGDSGGTIRLAKGGANRTTVLAGDTLGKIEFRSYDASLNHTSYSGTYAEIETVVTHDLGGLPSQEVRLDFKIADSDEPSSGKVITPVPALSIVQGGTVGIGITNPSANFVVSNAGQNGFEFNPNFNSNNSIIASYNRSGGGSYSQLTLSASQHIFSQGGTEYGRFNANGRLLLSGGATLDSSSLSHTLQVAASSDADGIAIIGRTADDIGELSFYEADKSTNLGEIQYRRTETNIRARSAGAEMNFATTTSGGSMGDRFTITADGNALFTNALGGSGVSQTNRNLVVGSNAEANLAIETHNNAASEGANIRFYKSRGTAASPTSVADDHIISQLMFYGHDGNDYAHPVGIIRAKVNGTPTLNQMPGELSFHTNHGAAYATERLKIQANGRITMGEANFDASNDLHLKKANDGGDVAMRITNNSGTNSGTTASLYFTTSPVQDFNTSYIQAVRQGGRLNFGYSTNAPTVSFKVSTNQVGINTDTMGTNDYLTLRPSGNNMLGIAYKLNNSNDVRHQYYDSGGTNRGGFGFTEYANNTDYPNYHDSFYWQTHNGTSLRTAMRMNNQGVLVRPYHPAFHWRKNAGQTYDSSWATITYGDKIFDRGTAIKGSDMVSSNAFTAPVTGIYFFHADANVVAYSGHYFYMAFFLNGNQYGRTIFAYNQERRHHQISMIIEMQQGDTVDARAKTNTSSVNGDNDGKFFGYLIG